MCNYNTNGWEWLENLFFVHDPSVANCRSFLPIHFWDDEACSEDASLATAFWLAAIGSGVVSEQRCALLCAHFPPRSEPQEEMNNARGT